MNRTAGLRINNVWNKRISTRITGAFFYNLCLKYWKMLWSQCSWEFFRSRERQREWGVCRSSLQNRLKGVHTGIVGSPKKFTDAEEDGLVELLLSCGELGVPISKVLLRKVVRNLGLSKGTVFVVVLWSIDWFASDSICPATLCPSIDWLIEREFIKSLLFSYIFAGWPLDKCHFSDHWHRELFSAPLEIITAHHALEKPDEG